MKKKVEKKIFIIGTSKMPRKDGFKSVKIISIDPETNPAFNYKPQIKKSL